MIYINSIGEILPQGNIEDGHFVCVEPVYSEIINPLLLRHKSRILKMGMGASGICISRLPETVPDAIIVGTGLACNADLKKFLDLVLEGDEQSLPPTPFIYSSNNSVAAQIAMMHKITGYNNTFCHHGSAFEAALLDAMMLLGEGEAQHVLVGGIDEYAPQYHQMMNEIYKTENTVIAGEGAVFFILEKELNKNTFAELKGVHSFLGITDCNTQFIKSEISCFLKKQSLYMADIDIFVSGKSGDCVTDDIYDELQRDYFQNAETLNFKNLCGEYMTSSSFALALAARQLKGQKEKRALICNHFNHYNHINYSVILLQTV